MFQKRVLSVLHVLENEKRASYESNNVIYPYSQSLMRSLSAYQKRKKVWLGLSCRDVVCLTMFAERATRWPREPPFGSLLFVTIRRESEHFAKSANIS